MNLFKTIGNSFIYIVSNTIVIVPYLLFIQLCESNHLYTILPFVLFYTFRTTGLFLIRGVKTNTDSSGVLRLSILLGLIGSVFAVIGFWRFNCYIISSVFLGLSASWLPMANTSLNMHLKHNEVKLKNNYIVTLFLLSLLLIAFIFGKDLTIVTSFFVYGIYYLCSFISLKYYPTCDYEVLKEDKTWSLKYLSIFILIFSLILLLRSGRLLNNTFLIMSAIFLFGVLFIIFEIMEMGKKNKRVVPKPLNNLSLINGIVGNFLFLFSSLYVSVIYGKDKVVLILYLPYVLGMFLSPIFGPKVFNKLPNKKTALILLAIILGLLIMLIPKGISLALFIISFSQSALSSELNKKYYKCKELPQDKRILSKYTTQNEGSLLHQFILMLIIYLIITIEKDPISVLLSLIGSQTLTPTSVNLMMLIKYVSVAIMVLIIGKYLVSNRKENSASK